MDAGSQHRPLDKGASPRKRVSVSVFRELFWWVPGSRDGGKVWPAFHNAWATMSRNRFGGVSSNWIKCRCWHHVTFAHTEFCCKIGAVPRLGTNIAAAHAGVDSATSARRDTSRMSTRRKQQISSQFAGVREQVKAKALEQARRVPWPRLADAVEEANRWQIFSLWVRGVVDAAHGIPPVVEREIEARIPGFLARVADDMQVALKQDTPGHRLWTLIDAWVTVNVLLDAKSQGWLDAVNYFSSMSMTYMKAWAHWERVNREWRESPPTEWPSYERWQTDVAAVTVLPNPDSIAQRVLDAVNSVSAEEWQRLYSQFRDLVAFSLWMELLLDLEGPESRVVREEIRTRYPEFSIASDLPPREVVRKLHSWVVERELRVDDENFLAALSWHVQNHPAYYALRNYAVHCHQAWTDNYPDRLPAFDEWRQAANKFTS